MTVILPRLRTAGTRVQSANNVANPTSLAPTLPTRVRGDVLLCWTWCRSNSATVATPSGWTLLTGFPIASGTTSGGKIYVFAALVDGSESAPTCSWSGVTTGTSGDASQAVINAYSGVDVSRGIANILDAAVQSSDQAASTTTVTIPAITTTTKHSLQLGLALKLLESSGATFTPPSNWTEENDNNTTSGTGHWCEIAHIVQDTIGSISSTTAAPSVTTSSRALGISFSLKCAKPPRNMGQFQNPGLF